MNEMILNPKIQIYKNQEAVFQAAREVVLESFHSALHERHPFAIALSGGKTPEPFYQSLTDPKLEINWNRTHIFMVDERFVPHTHPDSNWDMIRRSLVDRIQIPQKNLHPIMIEETAKASAEAYGMELQKRIHSKIDTIPSLDLMIMGLGSDGHTASLFPGTPALKVFDRLAVNVDPKDMPHSRITVTFPVLHQARRLLFMVLGENKAERIHDILIQKDEQYPATKACQGSGEVMFLLDNAAASHL